MGTELTTQQSKALSVSDAESMARMVAMSEHGTNALEKAAGTNMLKIMIGADMGVGPGAALRGIHIVKGKPELSGALWGALIGSSHEHRFHVLEKTDDKASIQFSRYEDGKWIVLGVETFTMKMAKDAGLTSNSTYQKYPANMVFWRCMSNGAKSYCPELTMGAAYAEGELDEGLENGIELPSDGPRNVTPMPVTPKSDMDLLVDQLAICSGILQGPENTEAQKAEKRRAHKDLLDIQKDQLEAPKSAKLSPKRMARLEELIDLPVPGIDRTYGPGDRDMMEMSQTEIDR